MPIAYIQKNYKHVGPVHVACQGLSHLGYIIEWFDGEELENLPLTKDTLVVGFIEQYRRAIEIVTGNKPSIFNYPDELKRYLDREVWSSTLGTIRNNSDLWPVFIKPANEIKSFAGRVVKSARDLISQAGLPNDTPVYCSKPVTISSEYRVFVKDKEVIGCRHYKGNPLIFPNELRILGMIRDWKDSPAAYCLDVGVVEYCSNWYDYQTNLIEINDAHSAGDYGLDPLIYARFLETRWCELTGALPIP